MRSLLPEAIFQITADFLKLRMLSSLVLICSKVSQLILMIPPKDPNPTNKAGFLPPKGDHCCMATKNGISITAMV